MGGRAKPMQNPSLVPVVYIHHSDHDGKSAARRDLFCILGGGEVYSAYSSNKVASEIGFALSIVAVSVFV